MKSLDYYKRLFARFDWKPPDDRMSYSFGVRSIIGEKPAPYICIECKIGGDVHEWADMLSSFAHDGSIFDFDLLTKTCHNAFRNSGLEPR